MTTVGIADRRMLLPTMSNYDNDGADHAPVRQDREPDLQLPRLERLLGLVTLVREVLELQDRKAMPPIARRSSRTRYVPAPPSHGRRHTSDNAHQTYRPLLLLWPPGSYSPQPTAQSQTPDGGFDHLRQRGCDLQKVPARPLLQAQSRMARHPALEPQLQVLYTDAGAVSLHRSP